MAKNDTHITPAGIAVWPKLVEPDTKFDEDGMYSVKLLLTEDEGAAFLKTCQELQQQMVDEALEELVAKNSKMKPEKLREKIKLATLPIKRYEDPETGEDTDKYVVMFKMKASGVSRKSGKEWSRRPTIFDAKGKEIKDTSKLQIWGGSTIKVAYTIEGFYTAGLGAGAKVRLEAVQIINLVSGSGRDAASYGFDAEDGGYEYQDDDDTGGDPFGNASGRDGSDSTGEADF